ncbi:MAG: uroporphyrinogen decarboxylase family protein [Clostridiales bacterium]|jgi:uroporphyrinogen decarboxylase|nr:uroporphyrinogen decarboxylase family protein [Clostridiales bacterium]
MTNREAVLETLNFRQSGRVPYNVDLTGQMREKMLADPAGRAAWEKANNHIASRSLGRPSVEVKPGYFQDEFGVIWNKTGVDRDIGVIDGKLIASPADLAAYELPAVDEAGVRRSCEALAADRENFTIADIGFSLFERAWTLCSMEDLLCYMITEPDFVHRLMQRITDYNLKLIDISLEYDIDCSMFGDDWGQQKGLIMGPALWREFVLPYLKQMYGRARSRKGRFVCQHSCGDIHEIFDDLIAAGLNIYQTFQPEIYDIRKWKPILDGRLTVWGAISTQRDLPGKTPGEIYEIATDTIRAMWHNGGYIAAPTHSVPPDVPVENIIAMLRAFEDYREC